MIPGAILGFGSLVFLILFWRARRYRSWFKVAAQRDDRFTWRAHHPIRPVLVAEDGFDVLPGVDRLGQTAFLVMNIEVSTRGRLFDPYIEFHDGDGQWKHRQYFERGAIGRRYLNLSPLFHESGDGRVGHVGLRGRWIRWKKEASLELFDPPRTEGASILVLAPHPDDAEIAALGMYAGPRSWVVTITAGEKGEADLAGVIAPHDRAHWSTRLRIWDSLTIPQMNGVSAARCVNLAYPDGDLERMHQHPDQAFALACESTLPRASLRSQNRAPQFQTGGAACTWNGLVADLRTLLEATKPDIVICPHPLLDIQRDHVFTAVALQQAAGDVSTAAPAVFLYAIHSSGGPLYPLGPADSLAALPPWEDTSWIAQSMYSHQLSPQMRLAKYFAVEAMHDMRRYDDGRPRNGLEVLRSVKRQVSAYVAGTGDRPTTLLRRGPRPNEIYFVVSTNALSELVGRALGAAGTPAPLSARTPGAPTSPR
jgi:LmbE family N-acetylglucosaminyl deacetylase